MCRRQKTGGTEDSLVVTSSPYSGPGSGEIGRKKDIHNERLIYLEKGVLAVCLKRVE